MIYEKFLPYFGNELRPFESYEHYGPVSLFSLDTYNKLGTDLYELLAGRLNIKYLCVTNVKNWYVTPDLPLSAVIYLEDDGETISDIVFRQWYS